MNQPNLSKNKHMRKILLSLMLLLTTTVSFSQKLPDYDPSHRWVTDLGGLFTPEQNNQIYQMLDQYEKQTSIEIAVLTVCDFESSPEDFSQKTAEKWGVGKKGVNNGIFIMISKCKVPHVFRVDIGYGLEGYLPDGWVKLQQDSIKIKYLQKSQYFEGTVALINKFTTKIGNEYSLDHNNQVVKKGKPKSTEDDYSWVWKLLKSIPWWVWPLIVGVWVIIFLISPELAFDILWLLFWILTLGKGGGGGGGFGGGKFGGGGSSD